MDERLRVLLDQIPEKAPRSKLEPHLEVIRELRRRRRTYEEIAQFFGEHLNVKVAASTIHAFVRVRAQRRQRRPQIELPPAGDNVPMADNGTGGGDAEEKERREALKRQPASAKIQKPRFEYDTSEPLRLQRTPETRREEKP